MIISHQKVSLRWRIATEMFALRHPQPSVWHGMWTASCLGQSSTHIWAAFPCETDDRFHNNRLHISDPLCLTHTSTFSHRKPGRPWSWRSHTPILPHRPLTEKSSHVSYDQGSNNASQFGLGLSDFPGADIHVSLPLWVCDFTARIAGLPCLPTRASRAFPHNETLWLGKNSLSPLSVPPRPLLLTWPWNKAILKQGRKFLHHYCWHTPASEHAALGSIPVILTSGISTSDGFISLHPSHYPWLASVPGNVEKQANSISTLKVFQLVFKNGATLKVCCSGENTLETHNGHDFWGGT